MLIGIDASRAVSSKWGGPENYSYYLIRALEKVDKRNSYRLYINSKPPRTLGIGDNFEIRSLMWPRFYTQGGLAWECMHRQPDLLFVPAHTIPVLRRPSLKTVVTIHDLAAQYLEQYYKFPGRLYLNKATEYCAKNASHIIAVSESTKRDLVQQFSVPGEKITVVYEGYDRDVFRPRALSESLALAKKYNFSKEYLLTVGTVQPRKNYKRLIKAFSSVSKQYPELNLVIVGKKGWLCEDIYKLPRQLHISQNVHFLGHVPDNELPILYSGAKAFVFPSLYEGFGLAPLEAMACGAPVVISDVSSLPEVGGDAATYVVPTSVASIEKGIRTVLSAKPGEREKLVEVSLLRASKFSWEQAAKETVGVFKKVVEH